MIKWVAGGAVTITIVLLLLIWNFSMVAKPIGIIKPSPLHSNQEIGKALAERFFVDMQTLGGIAFVFHDEKRMWEVGHGFLARLEELGGDRSKHVFIPFEKFAAEREDALKKFEGKVMFWVDSEFGVTREQMEAFKAQCDDKKPNAYIHEPKCRSARYSELHLRKKLDPKKPYFGAQRFSTHDYELYFYNP